MKNKEFIEIVDNIIDSSQKGAEEMGFWKVVDSEGLVSIFEAMRSAFYKEIIIKNGENENKKMDKGGVGCTAK